jgi:tape measure domain-containing protein
MAITLQELVVKLGLEDADFQRGLQGAESVLNRMGAKLTAAGSALTAGVTLPLAGLGAAALSAASDMDSLKRGLTVVAGSTEAANAQFKRLTELAKLPGLGLREVTQASVRLQAAGFSAEQAERSIKAFGNALAAVGSGKNELNAVIRQLQQMGNKPAVIAGDLRPIMDAVPQVATIIKQAFGTIDTEVIQKMGVSTQQMIETVVSGLEKIPQVTGGIKNQLENLGDTIFIALQPLGNAIIPIVSTLIDLLVPAIHAVSMAFAALPEPVRIAVVAIGGLLALAGPLLLFAGGAAYGLSALIGLFTPLGAGAEKAGSGFRVLSGAAEMAGNALRAMAPYLAAIFVGYELWGQIGTLASSFGSLATEIAKVVPAARDLGPAWLGVKAAVATLGVDVNGFGSALRAVIPSSDQFRQIWENAKGPLGAANAVLQQGTSVLRNMRGELALTTEAVRAHINSIGFHAQSVSKVVGQVQADAMKFFKDPKYLGGALTLFELPSSDELKKKYEEAKTALSTMVQAGAPTGMIESAKKKVDELRTALYGTAEEVKKIATWWQLIEMEQGERIQAGLKKAVDITTDWLAAGTLLGDKIELIRDNAYDISQILETIGKVKPMEFDVDTSKWVKGSVLETQQIMKGIGGTSSMDLNAEADRLGDAYERLVQLKQEGKATDLDVANAHKLWTEAEARAAGIKLENQNKQNEAVKQYNQEIQRAFNAMSRGMANAIVEWRGFGETLKSVAKSFLSGILEITIQQLLNPLQSAIQGALFGKDGKGGLLGGALSGLGSKIGDAISGGSKNVVSNIPGISKIPGVSKIPGLGGAGGGLASAANPVNMITGAISAGADVVSAVGIVRLEGTLNAVEHNTRYSMGHLEALLVKANDTWPAMQGINTFLAEYILPTLREIRDAARGFVGIDVALSPDSAGSDAVLKAVIDRAQHFDTTATDRLLDVTSAMGRVELAVIAMNTSVTKSIVDLTSVMAQMLHDLKPSLFDKITGFLGGGLFGGVGSMIGGVGSGIGGVLKGAGEGIGAAFKGIGEGIGGIIGGGGLSPEELTEQNTRYNFILTQQLVELANTHWPALSEMNFRVGELLAMIRDETFAFAKLGTPSAAAAGVTGPFVVAALVADDSNMETFADRLMDIFKNRGLV